MTRFQHAQEQNFYDFSPQHPAQHEIHAALQDVLEAIDTLTTTIEAHNAMLLGVLLRKDQ